MAPTLTTDTARAQIGFGTIRHRRLRPRSNQFSYRAYFLRLPMRHLDAALAPLRFIGHNRFALMSFYDRDHGGADGRTPLAWIDELLLSQGIDDAKGEVWLHTFARVLGYVFNPVSIWFCHRTDGALRAVVCEVNNTFGERHCYLLAHDDASPVVHGEPMTARKVFHVSPFCAVDGRYQFRFMVTSELSVARIDYDDALGPLIETSINGRLEPLSDAAIRRALMRFPLFTLTVVARIHWQALRLWLKRIPFFPKPPCPAAEVTK
jgi:DUF1365 family protein